MSEILSKSMHMSGAGAASSVAAKTETNGDDLLFAALFGGATGDISVMMIKLTLRSWLVYLPCKQANKMILRARHKRHCWQ